MHREPIAPDKVFPCPRCGRPVAWGWSRNRNWALMEVRGKKPPYITDLKHYPARCHD